MTRKPSVPEVGPPARPGVTGLGVKDGLREVRFNVRHEARRLVQAVAAATHRTEDARQGPMSLLGEPLNLAVRTAANLLNHVDLAAVDLLLHDASYRAMEIELRRSGDYFSGPPGPEDLRAFTTDHHWRYRHWLALTRRPEVFVHEQEIALAGAQVSQALFATPCEPANIAAAHTGADNRSTRGALIAQALIRQRIFSRPALSGNEDDDELAAWSALGGVAIVLAGEIAAKVPHASVRDHYAKALQLADEIVTADKRGWESALRSRTPTAALARWFAFASRYV